jgi:hypothetical protein
MVWFKKVWDYFKEEKEDVLKISTDGLDNQLFYRYTLRYDEDFIPENKELDKKREELVGVLNKIRIQKEMEYCTIKTIYTDDSFEMQDEQLGIREFSPEIVVNGITYKPDVSGTYNIV